MKKRHSLIILTLLSSLMMTSCSSSGSSGSNTPTPTPTPVATQSVTRVSIEPSELELDLKDYNIAFLTLTVEVVNDAPKTVVWESSNPTVATVEDGTVTALKEGIATIKATSTFDKSKYATCFVKVKGDGTTPTPGPEPEPEPEGEGNYSNPFTASQAYEYAKTLASGETSTLKYFIKGKIISEKFDTSGVSSYGNVNFKITDDGNASSNAFYCFQVYYLNAQKFTSASQIKVGDEVVMFSAIVNYNGNTPETTSKGSAYVFAHNGKESSTIPEQGFPEEDPNAKAVTISQLISQNSSWKSEGAKSGTKYRVTGVLQWPNNYNYGNFDIIDSSSYIAVHGCTRTKQNLVSSAEGYVINNDKSFSSIGAKPGDEITIEGWYAYHAYSSNYGIPQFTGYVTKLVKKNLSNITPLSYTASEDSTLSYYESVNSLTGKDLLLGLHNLMNTTHKTYTTYKSLDNHFTKSDKYSGGGVKCFYSGEKASSFNKEHVWPQSQSGSSSQQLYGEDGGGSDLHHIRPTINEYNSKRGNSAFGPIYGSDSYKGGSFSYEGGGKVNYVNSVFEPVDSMKGDVARIIMYVYMHYNDGTLSELSSLSGWAKNSYYGEMHINWVMGPNTSTECFNLLRRWNAMDPVSQEEKTRNEYTYSVQGNRNPFIDHPSYADKIWG